VKNSLGSNWPQRTPTLNIEWGQIDPKGNRRVKQRKKRNFLISSEIFVTQHFLHGYWRFPNIKHVCALITCLIKGPNIEIETISCYSYTWIISKQIRIAVDLCMSTILRNGLIWMSFLAERGRSAMTYLFILIHDPSWWKGWWLWFPKVTHILQWMGSPFLFFLFKGMVLSPFVIFSRHPLKYWVDGSGVHLQHNPAHRDPTSLKGSLEWTERFVVG